MNFQWLMTNALAALILPPMGLVLLAGVGWRLSNYWFYSGRSLVAVSVLLLIALSTEAGADLLAGPLEHQYALEANKLSADDIHRVDVIVILGGGRGRSSAGPGPMDQVGPQTLMRLRTGAQLHRQTRLPMLVSGGAPDGAGDSEAVLMARSLREDFGVAPRWVEDRAANTAENALFSSHLLRKHQRKRVLLVTDALHMPRARMAFERAGLDVVPAPASFISGKPFGLASFIPTAQALRNSHYALHEWLGLIWYQVSLGAAL
jgi:uncharacterized SAM-binding protein YcdF (DUF218 family)